MNLIKKRNLKNNIFHVFTLCMTLIGVIFLLVIIGGIVVKGIGHLNISFLTHFPSRFASKAGILPGLIGSLYVVALTMLISVPIGIGTAIYLEEYAKEGLVTKILKICISNLAGTPSIVFGILGLTIFVRYLMLGKTIISAGLTLSLVILPILIVSSQEAIKTVPQYLRHASYAIGATKWQTIRCVVVPSCFSGIMTGIILSISRAFGETAPLILIGAATYITFLPKGLDSGFSVLPIQIYNWMGLPKAEFQELAATAITVLLCILLIINVGAIFLRNKFQKNLEI